MSNISISEAATRLGRKPWEVVRLVDAGLLQQVVLIDEASVTELARSSA